MAYKQYQQIVNLLTYEEVTKIKELKKSRVSLYNRISKIPDCCFQIHWKALSKSLISFKNLPKDVIVVYKK